MDDEGNAGGAGAAALCRLELDDSRKPSHAAITKQRYAGAEHVPLQNRENDGINRVVIELPAAVLKSQRNSVATWE